MALAARRTAVGGEGRWGLAPRVRRRGGGTRPGGEPRLVQPDAAGLDHAAPEILHLLLHGEHVVAIEIQDVVAAGEDELAHRRRVQRLLERAAQRASASGGVPAGAYSPVQPYSVSEG